MRPARNTGRITSNARLDPKFTTPVPMTAPYWLSGFAFWLGLHWPLLAPMVSRGPTPPKQSVTFALPDRPVYRPVPLRSLTRPEPEKENEQVALSMLGWALFSFAFKAVESTSKPPFCNATLTKLPFAPTSPFLSVVVAVP